jgi:hypothetical protein
VVGKSTKPKADAAADTMESPHALPQSDGSTPEVMGAIEGQSTVVLGSRSSERIILSAGSQGIGQCLARHEVVAYLGPACPRNLRARVDAHIVDCVPCGRWVRHVDDEVLEYIGGQRSEEELARMDAHLDACKVCRDLMHHVLQGMAQSWHGEQRDPGDASTTFVAGNVVNSRYLIRSFVGRGGMGEVYEAFDRLMDRRIALKTMLCTAADRPRAARRFKEEVRNAQRVGHPHVCRINDLQEHQEGAFGPPLPFFTMEYIDGERLGNRLLEGPLSLDEARVIALQLLDGLRAAHQRGVLHLDFKSDNVMLRRETAEPDAVIMDFGLSRVLGNESKLRTSDRRQFAGTLPYMSVEQLECREDLGPPTDIYAFGVVLYEMLTRALPFEGDALGAVLLKQLNERPKPPSRRVPGLVPALDRFVLKCLSNNPGLRYQDAGQALLALEAIGPWFRTPGSRARLWMWAAPVAVVAAGLGLFMTAPSTRPAPADPASPSADVSAPPGRTPIDDPRRVAPTTEAALTSGAAATPAPPSAAPANPPPKEVHRPSNRTGPAAPRRVRDDALDAPPPIESTPARTLQEPAAGEPKAGEPKRLEPTTAADQAAAWKPSRVPKRLSAPVPSPKRREE